MSKGLSESEIDQLALVFASGIQAKHLLAAAGLDRARQPQLSAGNALDFWREVNELIIAGKFDDGRRSLLAAALNEYPHNPIFQAGATRRDLRPGQDAEGLGVGGVDGLGGVGGHVRGGGVSAEAYPFTILALDTKGYSSRPTTIQQEWRAAIRVFVTRAAQRVHLDSDLLVVQDSGDGVLVGFPASIPKRAVVADFVSALRDEMVAHNQSRNELARIRMRAGIHHDDVVVDGPGFAGAAAVVAARLIDAAPTRMALDQLEQADLAVILSDEMYRSTAGQGFLGIDHRQYRRVPVVVDVAATGQRKYSASGWLTVPGFDVATLRLDEPDEPDGPGGQGAPGGQGGPGEPKDDGRDGDSSAAGVPRGAASAAGPPPSPGGTAASRKLEEGKKWHFLISHAPEDVEWAEWISWQLHDSGYKVYLESNEIEVGDSRMEQYNRAIELSARTIVVLSSNYLIDGDHHPAWHYAFLNDPQGFGRRLLPVRIEECTPPGFIRDIVRVDLFDLDSEEAAAKLISKVNDALYGRAKPAGPPPFPSRSTPNRSTRSGAAGS